MIAPAKDATAIKFLNFTIYLPLGTTKCWRAGS